MYNNIIILKFGNWKSAPKQLWMPRKWILGGEWHVDLEEREWQMQRIREAMDVCTMYNIKIRDKIFVSVVAWKDDNKWSFRINFAYLAVF